MSQLSLFADRSSAVISPCGLYRHALHRRWDEGPQCLFVMLNPSTADHAVNDPTIRRCMGFASPWGFGAIAVGNLFALRATQPRALKHTENPVGPQNDDWLTRLADESQLIVTAWGNHGGYRDRANIVRTMLGDRPLHYLRLTKQGQPQHPLYVPASIEPSLWEATS